MDPGKLRRRAFFGPLLVCLLAATCGGPSPPTAATTAQPSLVPSASPSAQGSPASPPTSSPIPTELALARYCADVANAVDGYYAPKPNTDFSTSAIAAAKGDGDALGSSFRGTRTAGDKTLKLIGQGIAVGGRVIPQGSGQDDPYQGLRLISTPSQCLDSQGLAQTAGPAGIEQPTPDRATSTFDQSAVGDTFTFADQVERVVGPCSTDEFRAGGSGPYEAAYFSDCAGASGYLHFYVTVWNTTGTAHKFRSADLVLLGTGSRFYRPAGKLGFAKILPTGATVGPGKFVEGFVSFYAPGAYPVALSFDDGSEMLIVAFKGTVETK